MGFAGRSALGYSGGFLRAGEDGLEMTKLIRWIILSCVVSCTLASVFFVHYAVAEVFLGMVIPTAVGVVILSEVGRILGREPSRLTAFMIKAFWLKMVFYGVCTLVIVGLLSFQAVPFIVSFTIYFIGLQIVEALYFRTLSNT